MSVTAAKPLKRIDLNYETGMVTCHVGANDVCTVKKELLNIDSGEDLLEFTKHFSSIDDAISHVCAIALSHQPNELN